jgi:hypothetical protein
MQIEKAVMEARVLHFLVRHTVAVAGVVSLEPRQLLVRVAQAAVETGLLERLEHLELLTLDLVVADLVRVEP